MRVTALLLAHVAACWPVWRWWAARVGDGGESSWGLLPLAAAAVLALRERRTDQPVHWGLPAALLLLYAAAFAFLPPLGRSILAVASVAAALGAVTGAPRPGLAGLLLLSLPLVPSAQFLLGHPLRLAVSWLAASLLAVQGFPLDVRGACLEWNGGLVCVDAPCSGVAMLWTGAVVAMVVAVAQRLSTWRTIALALASGALVVAGNALRVSSLFFLEAVAGVESPFLHQAVGAVVFSVVAAVIMALGTRLGRAPCAA